MDVRAELEQAISSYLAEEITLDQLYVWLAEHAQAMSSDLDNETRKLSGRAWLLLSEYDYGHRDEPSIKCELPNAVRRAGALR